MAGPLRLFVAFLLDEPVRAALRRVQEDLSPRCRGVRWTPREQLHVTVEFLGEVADPDVANVAEAVGRAARVGRSFGLTIEGCGCFPSSGPVRIVWAGARDDTGGLDRCVEAVQRELARIGCKRECRRWMGHTTIGRVRNDRSAGRLRSAVEACDFDPVAQTMRAVTLMSSDLAPDGAIHRPVHSARLGDTNFPLE